MCMTFVCLLPPGHNHVVFETCVHGAVLTCHAMLIDHDPVCIYRLDGRALGCCGRLPMQRKQHLHCQRSAEDRHGSLFAYSLPPKQTWTRLHLRYVCDSRPAARVPCALTDVAADHCRALTLAYTVIFGPLSCGRFEHTYQTRNLAAIYAAPPNIPHWDSVAHTHAANTPHTVSTRVYRTSPAECRAHPTAPKPWGTCGKPPRRTRFMFFTT